MLEFWGFPVNPLAEERLAEKMAEQEAYEDYLADQMIEARRERDDC